MFRKFECKACGAEKPCFLLDSEGLSEIKEKSRCPFGMVSEWYSVLEFPFKSKHQIALEEISAELDGKFSQVIVFQIREIMARVIDRMEK